jgi:hypothetical protein
MKRVNVYFNQYFFIAVLHCVDIPVILFFLQKICSGVSYLLSPINWMDIGYLFWEKVCLPLDLYTNRISKVCYIRIPWEFAKKYFPDDYKKNRKGGFVFKEFEKERKEVAANIEKLWTIMQKTMGPAYMKRKIIQKNKKTEKTVHYV